MSPFNKDSINLLSCLTFSRILNFLKLYVSFGISGIFRKPLSCGMPFAVSVEPTNNCNLKCLECPAGQGKMSRAKGMLSFVMFKSVIDELHKNLIYLTLNFQGEPYLNADLFEFVKYAKSKNIYTATSTNAHFLDDDNSRKTVESGLDRLIISVDGTEQNAYSSYRVGGDIDKVKQGIENIIKWKKQLDSEMPFVVLQFLVLKTNEHQIAGIKRYAEKVGADKLELKSVQIYDSSNFEHLLPSADQYARYKKHEGKYVIKNKLRNRCFRMWSSCVITWDGFVVPCCFDKDAEYTMGNINTSPLRSIWKSSNYNTYRKKIFKSRKSVGICCNCTE